MIFLIDNNVKIKGATVWRRLEYNEKIDNRKDSGGAIEDKVDLNSSATSLSINTIL